MAKTKETLGDRIRKSRESKEWTQANLAFIVAVSPVTVSRWETGAVTPTLQNTSELAKALHVSLTWLTRGVAS